MTTDAWHGRVLGGYRVAGRLGTALGGELYAAEQIDRSRPVILKIVSASVAASSGFAERFERDAALLAAFFHPHVATVYEAGVQDGTHYLATRPVEGPTLERVIADAGMLDHVRVTELIAQVAAALDAVHERGVVHGGLSPASIVVRRHEGAELASITDFAVVDDTSLYGGLFDRPSGTAPPPIDYAAPEQVRGERATPRTDVYALGAILFTALTGSPPFSDRPAGATLEAHLHEPVPSVALIDELPAGFDEIFARALAKDPADRYASASELAVALPNKLRVLSTWRSMLVAGTMAPGADPAAGSPAQPEPLPPPAALTAPAPAVAAPLPADDLDDGVFDLGDDEVDTGITGETGELPQTEEDLDDSLVARALAPPEPARPQRRVGRPRGPRYRAPRNRTKPRKKRPLPDIEPIAVPERPVPARRKRSKVPFIAVAVLLLATVASLLAAAGAFDGAGAGDGERASVTTPTVSEARALAQLRKDGEARVARERAARKAAAAKTDGGSDKAAADKAAADKAKADKAAAAKAKADKAAAAKSKADKAAAAKSKADKAAADKSNADKSAADKAAAAKAKADKAKADKAAADKAKADKAASGSGSAGSGGSSTSGAGSSASAASLRWPSGRSAYTAVIYASSSDRAGALKRARRAAASLGVRTGVLRSSDFSNLEPGVWVAFAGVYSSEARAQRAADRLKRAGLAPAPYTRFVASR
jgi:hypothetical protein